MVERRVYTDEEKKMNRKLMVDNMSYLFQKYYPVWAEKYPEEAAEFFQEKRAA